MTMESASDEKTNDSNRHQQQYPTGEPAIQLDASGCGFCYYLSGRVAACISKVNSYQRRYQFYEDNVKRTLLATFDEHAVGSAGHPKGNKVILTKDGGMITDANNLATQAWRWDPKALHAGTPPTEPIVIQLNDALTFSYKDKRTITVQFLPCPGVSIDFACGEKLRRTDTYLEKAHRLTQGPYRGKLVIDQEVPTLKQRQKLIELESIEKRSKQKPRSKDLTHDRIKQVVATLETKFDRYEGVGVTPAADGQWREKAQAKTKKELPMLPKTGFEVGTEPTLFGEPVQPNDATETNARLKNPETGEWLGSVELHYRLASENPVLRRSACLTNASGRYSRDLTIPNGGIKVQSESLKTIPGEKLDEFVQTKSPPDVLVVVACLRMDDHHSRLVESTLEQIQAQLNEHAKSPATSLLGPIGAQCLLVKCELTQSQALARRFRIHAVPTYLLFYNGRLVQTTSFGGTAVRVFPATKNAHLSHQMDQLPRVLLVEKAAKQQVAIEKVLRKEAFRWDLAISGEQALSYFTRQPPQTFSPATTNVVVVGSTPKHPSTTTTAPTTTYGILMLSDELEDFEVRTIDRLVRPKEKGKSIDQLVCVVVTKPVTAEIAFASTMCVDCRRALGRRISNEAVASSTKSSDREAPPPTACPHCGIISAESKTNVLRSAVLAEAVHVMVYKHVKAATMHRLAEMWRSRAPVQSSSSSVSSSPLKRTSETHTGLTIDGFFAEVERQLQSAKRGLFFPDNQIPDMALSTKDAVLAATTASLAAHKMTKTVVVNALRSSSA